VLAADHADADGICIVIQANIPRPDILGLFDGSVVADDPVVSDVPPVIAAGMPVPYSLRYAHRCQGALQSSMISLILRMMSPMMCNHSGG